VAPSYRLCQDPEVGEQAGLTTTDVPSRLSTVSRVSHVPEMLYAKVSDQQVPSDRQTSSRRRLRD
jgi:hypothetical protein